LLYIDDIVFTISSIALLQQIIYVLKQEFAMKDVEPLHHFLGVYVQDQVDRLFLTQRRFALDILERVGMVDCKSVSTPVDTHAKVSVESVPPIADLTHFRSLTRALQFMTFTHPDIAYAVQQICSICMIPKSPTSLP
jgi:hypothetical protein